MKLSDRFIDLISQTASALWASNCDKQRVPDLVRVQGVRVDTNKEQITFYVSVKMGETFLQNFTMTDKLSLLMASTETHESYQLKGSYLSQRPCTSSEIQYQKEYLLGFCKAIEGLGISKEKAFALYYQQPTVAVRMLVQEVYEQTPKIGTGEKMSSL